MILVVRQEGLEPSHLSAPEPKSGVSTNSTTGAVGGYSSRLSANYQPRQPVNRPAEYGKAPADPDRFC